MSLVIIIHVSALSAVVPRLYEVNRSTGLAASSHQFTIELARYSFMTTVCLRLRVCGTLFRLLAS